MFLNDQMSPSPGFDTLKQSLIAQAMPAHSCKASQAYGNKDHLANVANCANRALLGVRWKNFL